MNTLNHADLTSHLILREKMVLNTKTTQKMGHTTSPSQKIRDSAPDVVNFPICRKQQQQQDFISDRSIKIHVKNDNSLWEVTGSMAPFVSCDISSIYLRTIRLCYVTRSPIVL